MARTSSSKKNIRQILALVVAVVVVLGVVFVATSWWNSRPGRQPQDVSVTAHVGDQSTDVFPYMLFEPGVEPNEGEPTVVELGPDEKMTLDIPREIHNHDWQLLTIYDDPAANEQQLFAGYDSDSVTVAGSLDPLTEGGPRPRLVVVEISSVLIGTDANGEETPYTTYWSIATGA